jgi:fatty-acyl-CoA synthase
MDAPRTLIEMLQNAVRDHGERTALIGPTERWSYEDLAGRVDRLARALIAQGVGKGSRVGLLLENQPDWVAFAFAATGLGALLIPISTFSKEDDLAYQIRHADVQHLFLSASFLGNDYLGMLCAVAPELERANAASLFCEALPALRRVVVRGAETLPPGSEAWADFEMRGGEISESVLMGLREAVDSEDECYLLYTSGTTARPKGVVQVHEAIASNGWLIGEYQCLDATDVVWFYYPLFFSAGCINVMLGTLSHGAALIIQSSFDPAVALELIEREKATTWHLWPHTLKELTQHPDWSTRDHSLLHKGTGPFDAMQGGPPEDGFGGVNMYGMTETCTAFTCTPADAPLTLRLTTCGHSMPGHELKIIDLESHEPVKAGESGEICVRGRAVMRGYYKVDKASVFDSQGFFRTGDLGRLDEEGRLIFDRRIKDTIKTGGINVAPADIEAKLGNLEGVVDAYAFPIPSAERGEVVGAALVVEAGQTIDEASIREHCREFLSGYKRPEGLIVLEKAEVPMTGSGKVQKGILRDRLLAGMAEDDASIVYWN